MEEIKIKFSPSITSWQNQKDGVGGICRTWGNKMHTNLGAELSM